MKKLNFKTIAIGVNALLVIIIVICLLQINGYSRTLRSQEAAELWRGQNEMRFAQVSAFLPVDKLAGEMDVLSFRVGIEPALVDAGVEIPKEGRLWTDAYSGTGTVTVSGNKGAFPATAIGVAGDFFLFHPYELLSGSYISDQDFMQDRVVLDQDLAWKLFGASDLGGMSVTIGGKPYYVAGVVQRETDSFSEKAFGTGEPLIFMSYAAAVENISDFGISCYESVIADPITDFAKNTVNEKFAPSAATVIQNTDRYSFGRIYEMFGDFGARSILNTGISYPYWENAARVSEDYVARIYVVIALAGAIPLIFLVWLFARLIILINKKIKQAWLNTKDAWDDRYARIDDYKTKAQTRKKSKAQKPKSKAKSAASLATQDEETVAMDIESIVREIMEQDV